MKKYESASSKTLLCLVCFACEVEKLRLSGLELRFFTLESGALPACPFTAETLISCRALTAVYFYMLIYSALNSITLVLAIFRKICYNCI